MLAAAWSTSHPNEGRAAVETWVLAADTLQARPKLNLELVSCHTKGGVGKGIVDFSALREQGAGDGAADSRE